MGEKRPVICTESCDFHAYSFTCRKYATWDKRLYFPSEGRSAEDFFRPEKSEPANLGTKRQHASTRPPKLQLSLYFIFTFTCRVIGEPFTLNLICSKDIRKE